ncbi:YtxH domain-containing protein [Arachidicoccus terrestris]|jgi:gas vesicle protein|uniref:YtxH domain-containing protein n=1 Tax=Arachidicoccus terrestris TaxID=2875539 RepID=UPI001CC76443|nr:YtxH domain-containing protein [Arachidicoccus terrestris]UAY54225.1 YtxH domain-containing protein [Arachidicoccus terrestris]
MKNNQKFLSGFLLGAAAGAIVTSFLNGDKGQTVIQNFKNVVREATDDLKTGLENFDEKLEKWTNKGRDFIADLKGSNKKEDMYDLEEIFS